MNWKRTAQWSWLVLPFLLLALWPAVAAAQLGIPHAGIRSDANAVLYEVTENLKFKSFAQMKRRMATSALMGTIDDNSPLCPVALAGGPEVPTGKCAIVAMASDNLSLKTGKGPVSGEFAVVIQGDNNTDAPELVILRGSLEGKIDLGLALLFATGSGGAPLGTIQGHWSATGVAGGPLTGVHVHGTFQGTFRLPFQLPFALGPIPPGTVLYAGDSFLVPTNLGDVIFPNPSSEYSLGVPTVRLEINFVETHNHHDNE